MVWEIQVVICILYSIPWLGKLRAATAAIWAPPPWVCSSGKDGCLCPKWCLRLRSWAPALSCFSLQAFTWNFSSEMQKHKFMSDLAHFTEEKQGHSILGGLLLRSKAPVLWSGPNSILHCCKSEGFVQILHRDDNCPAEWAPGALVNLGVGVCGSLHPYLPTGMLETVQEERLPIAQVFSRVAAIGWVTNWEALSAVRAVGVSDLS